jgi:hypothetical protein
MVLSAEIVDVLAVALKNPGSDIRGKAARNLLSNEGHRDAAVETVAKIIADERERALIRCDAIDELPAEFVSVPAIRSALQKALESHSGSVRSSAKETLSRADES